MPESVYGTPLLHRNTFVITCSAPYRLRRHLTLCFIFLRRFSFLNLLSAYSLFLWVLLRQVGIFGSPRKYGIYLLVWNRNRVCNRPYKRFCLHLFQHLWQNRWPRSSGISRLLLFLLAKSLRRTHTETRMHAGSCLYSLPEPLWISFVLSFLRFGFSRNTPSRPCAGKRSQSRNL